MALTNLPPRTALPILAATLLCVATGSALAVPRLVNAPARPWLDQPIHLSLEARLVQEDAAYGAHVVRPLIPGRSTNLLLEAYGYEGEGDLGAVGAGLIWRHSPGRDTQIEFSAFFDELRAADGFSYPQIGMGVAVSHGWLTLRGNGYVPLRGKDRDRRGTETWSTIEGSGAVRGRQEWTRLGWLEREPMRGFEAEAEFRLPEPPKWIDPRLAIGYSYREAEQRPEVYSGALVRGELRFAQHFIADAEWRQDSHGAGQEWRVGVRFEMLFGGSAEAHAPRVAERYAPVTRFPWPTVARGAVQSKALRGAAAPATVAGPADQDCCGNPGAPLSFE